MHDENQTATFGNFGNNASPDLPQNQLTGMSFGQGAGVNDPQDIPNITSSITLRLVTY
jgi:hypothetical protein